MTEHAFTRWRFIDNPVDASDPIGELSFLQAGKLPRGFVIMLTDEHMTTLKGPYRFPSQEDADSFLEEERGWVKQYLIIPGPKE